MNYSCSPISNDVSSVDAVFLETGTQWVHYNTICSTDVYQGCELEWIKWTNPNSSCDGTSIDEMNTMTMMDDEMTSCESKGNGELNYRDLQDTQLFFMRLLDNQYS